MSCRLMFSYFCCSILLCLCMFRDHWFSNVVYMVLFYVLMILFCLGTTYYKRDSYVPSKVLGPQQHFQIRTIYRQYVYNHSFIISIINMLVSFSFLLVQLFWLVFMVLTIFMYNETPNNYHYLCRHFYSYKAAGEVYSEITLIFGVSNMW